MTTDDELGRRIRRLADALPVQMQEPPATTTVTRRSSPHLVRRVVLAASALAIVAATVAVIANRNTSRAIEDRQRASVGAADDYRAGSDCSAVDRCCNDAGVVDDCGPDNDA